MKNRVQAILLLLTMVLLSFPRLALAAVDNTAGGTLSAVTPSSLATNIASAIQAVGMPLGGAVLLFSVVITAVQIIISRFNPGQRESAMSNLWYVGLGGILLGGALFFASLFFNIGGTYFN